MFSSFYNDAKTLDTPILKGSYIKVLRDLDSYVQKFIQLSWKFENCEHITIHFNSETHLKRLNLCNFSSQYR